MTAKKQPGKQRPAKKQHRKELPRYKLRVAAESNGKLGMSTIMVVDEDAGKTCFSDELNLTSDRERTKAAGRIVAGLKLSAGQAGRFKDGLDELSNDLVKKR
jgi:hypothetical protein